MRYNEYLDEFVNEGWVCPRCGRVNAPFVMHCDCKVGVSYTRDTSTTSPSGISYTIYPSSSSVSTSSEKYDYDVTSKEYPSTSTEDTKLEYDKYFCNVVDRDVEMLDTWFESLKRYEQFLDDDK